MSMGAWCARKCATYESLRSERGVTWGFEDHDGAVDMNDGDGGDGAQLLPELLGLGREDIPVLVRLTCIGARREFHTHSNIMHERRRRLADRDAACGKNARHLPTTLLRHSYSGMASRWLHFRRSKVLARSTAGWCCLPER